MKAQITGITNERAFMLNVEYNNQIELETLKQCIQDCHCIDGLSFLKGAVNIPGYGDMTEEIYDVTFLLGFFTALASLIIPATDMIAYDLPLSAKVAILRNRFDQYCSELKQA